MVVRVVVLVSIAVVVVPLCVPVPVPVFMIVAVPVVVSMAVPMIVIMPVPVTHVVPSSTRSRKHAIRCTAIAAPKPLSMFTTVTPLAQLVSIAKSGVKPESAVP